ncbi:MAG: DnaK suppressor protein [Pseudonocardiales bacterium]|nr:DnaK suppressor protein [Pseudonocardiales bacterium]MDQ1752961.1 DnaK suppressor protein [Pseudonocardiales bacterium]
MQRVLLEDRAAALSRIRAMTGDIESMVLASADANADDEHDPEGSTIAFERAQALALLAQARASLKEIELALIRLRDASYGVCEICGNPISPERLAARPAARTCIGCATADRRH